MQEAGQYHVRESLQKTETYTVFFESGFQLAKTFDHELVMPFGPPKIIWEKTENDAERNVPLVGRLYCIQ
jgi:hypothetical protein